MRLLLYILLALNASYASAAEDRISEPSWYTKLTYFMFNDWVFHKTENSTIDLNALNDHELLYIYGKIYFFPGVWLSGDDLRDKNSLLEKHEYLKLDLKQQLWIYPIENINTDKGSYVIFLEGSVREKLAAMINTYNPTKVFFWDKKTVTKLFESENFETSSHEKYKSFTSEFTLEDGGAILAHVRGKNSIDGLRTEFNLVYIGYADSLLNTGKTIIQIRDTIAGSLLFISLFFILQTSIKGNRLNSFLIFTYSITSYLSIFCLSLATSADLIMNAIAVLNLISSLFLTIWLIYQIKDHISKRIYYSLISLTIAINLPGMALISLNQWQLAGIFLLLNPLFNISTLIYTNLIALKRLANGKVLLVGSILFCIFVWDIILLIAIPQVRNTQFQAYIASLIMAFTQAVLYAKDFASLHKKVEDYAHELEEKEKARTLFFHNTSHELRTPINGIMGYLELVLAGRYGDLQEGASQQIKKALSLVDSLKYQVNTILDLAKSKKGSLSAYYQDQSLREIKTEIDNLAEGLKLKKPGLNYSSRFIESSERFVCDREKVNTIIRNLIGNAFKFKDPLRDNHVEFELISSSEFLEVRVKDTGIGIPKEQQSKIFEEFSQVESDARRRYEGTGLGLAMVRDLVAVMNGTIELESIPDEGSCFLVRIPTHEPSPEAPVEDVKEISHISMESNKASIEKSQSIKPSITASDASWKVLVIDDTETNCEVITEMLRVDGYSLDYCLSGKKGLELIRKDPPHLLLLDLMMPEVSGEDVLLAIREDPDLKHLPVVLITARASEEDRIFGLSLGADDYLPKPIVANELRLRVHRMIERQKMTQELIRSYQKLDSELDKTASLERELKQAGSQLANAEKMTILAELAIHIANDLSAPAQAIVGAQHTASHYLKIIEERILSILSTSDEDQAKEIETLFRADFKEIRSSLEEILNSNRNITEIQMLARNQVQLETEDTNNLLASIIQDSLILLKSRLKDIQVKADVERDLYISGKRAQLTQAIINIVTNSLEALETSSDYNSELIGIQIQAKTSPENSRQVIIEIEDSGCGIQEKQKALEAFYSTKLKAKGLGLSMASKIIAAHSGGLKVEDAKTLQGARIVITLEKSEANLEAAS